MGDQETEREIILKKDWMRRNKQKRTTEILAKKIEEKEKPPENQTFSTADYSNIN